MDDFDEFEFEGPAVAFMAVEVYDFFEGEMQPHAPPRGTPYPHINATDGYFECTGFIDVNPMMIETVEYVDTHFITYQKTITQDRWLWWTNDVVKYEEELTRVCFYKQTLASGQELLTKQPILPGTGDPGHDDESFEVKYDDKVRPLFGQEFPGNDE